MRVFSMVALVAVTLTLAAAQSEPNIRWYKVVNNTTKDTTGATEDDPFPCAQGVSVSTTCSGSDASTFTMIDQNGSHSFGCTSNHAGVKVRKDQDGGTYTVNWECPLSSPSAPEGTQSVTQIVKVTGTLSSCDGRTLMFQNDCQWSKYPR